MVTGLESLVAIMLWQACSASGLGTLKFNSFWGSHFYGCAAAQLYL